jgi:hypothetical protein
VNQIDPKKLAIMIFQVEAVMNQIVESGGEPPEIFSLNVYPTDHDFHTCMPGEDISAAEHRALMQEVANHLRRTHGGTVAFTEVTAASYQQWNGGAQNTGDRRASFGAKQLLTKGVTSQKFSPRNRHERRKHRKQRRDLPSYVATLAAYTDDQFIGEVGDRPVVRLTLSIVEMATDTELHLSQCWTAEYDDVNEVAAEIMPAIADYDGCEVVQLNEPVSLTPCRACGCGEYTHQSMRRVDYLRYLDRN